MSSKIDTRVIQVTNIAPSTTKDQLKTLFQFIGRIREIKVFPPEGSDQQVVAKVCYIEFDDSMSAGVSLHLTNTVFIDRALIVVPVMDGKIPDEKVAMQLTPQAVAKISQGQPSWPANVVSQTLDSSLWMDTDRSTRLQHELTGSGAGQMITTYDPRLNALGLPQYPPLPAALDAAKVEEIRRTVYIGNLDHKTNAETLIQFFSSAGEVKYCRMAGDETAFARGAYLEMTDQRAVATCLGYNGVSFNGRIITVSHAKTCIAKPLSKSQEASRREVEEAMKKVKEAQSLISAAADAAYLSDKTRSRSRSRRRSHSRGGYSRSRSRSRRSRSRSRGVHRRRSRSRSRRRSRSPRRIRRSRSRSPRRRRSRSRSGIVVIPARERRRSRSRSKRKSRTKSPKRRSRTPPRAYSSRRSRSRKEPFSVERVSVPEVKKATSEAIADKKATAKRSKSPTRRRKSVSRSPVRVPRKRTASRSPTRGSRRRSLSPRKRRSKSRSPRRSRSPLKKKKARSPRRSRSGSRHRSKKDKKKERSRSRERKEKKKEKKSNKEKRDSKEKLSGKVIRDYDEEEKGYNSGAASDREEETKSPRREDYDRESDRASDKGSQQAVDMDTSD